MLFSVLFCIYQKKEVLFIMNLTMDETFICKAIFSDIDGTFLTSDHLVSQKTLIAIRAVMQQGIPFSLITARNPLCIQPILDRIQLSCNIIGCNGALILDENHNLLYEKGFSVSETSDLLYYIEQAGFDLAWNLYTATDWYVKDRTDPRILWQEGEVEVTSKETLPEQLPSDTVIAKVLCICNHKEVPMIELALQRRFPEYTIVKSAPTLLEITAGGINKAQAFTHFCQLKQIAPEHALAFGDNYNDVEMLETAGCGILMENAPADLKEKGFLITADNDHDGIAMILNQLSII